MSLFELNNLYTNLEILDVPLVLASLEYARHKKIFTFKSHFMLHSHINLLVCVIFLKKIQTRYSVKCKVLLKAAGTREYSKYCSRGHIEGGMSVRII